MITDVSNVFFVENIISLRESSEDKNEKKLVVLLNASPKTNLAESENNLSFITVEKDLNQISSLNQGQFVYYKDNEFVNANSSTIARSYINYNNFYRGRLLKNNLAQGESLTLDLSNARIFSYHVNVGHGNCSIVVLEGQGETILWLIDCSNYDFLEAKNYDINIDECFKHIRNKFLLKEILFDKCFLTHPHFDHYSGIGRLINEGKISNKTEFYLNLHYSMASDNYNGLLKRIFGLKSKIIEPIVSNSSSLIDIWYPHTTTIRTNTSKYSGQNVLVESNPNNASTVLHFNIGKKSILFTGDIEQKGWDSIKKCPKYLKESDYFVISHHGSINGHLRSICPFKRNINNLSDCVLPDSTPILMGKNNAYPGIYSKQVLNNFNQNIKSEADRNSNKKKLLWIDWQTNIPNWL